MQMISKTMWALFFALALFSCKKEGTPGTEQPPKGVATQVGVPDGAPISQKTIGAAGGSLSSSDGRLKLTIPAGALAADQQVSIQSISNHNPMAIRKAYRLLPHGVTFSKPVTIEFSYSNDDISNTIPEALGIAYQDAKGVWQAIGGVEVDKAAKTAKITTTHFSDWSLFESFYLYRSAEAVQVKGTVQLKVYCVPGLIGPLKPGVGVPISEKEVVAGKFIREWKLAGAGNLQPNGASAVYKAPATVPNAPNPVAVSVSLDLKDGKMYQLVQHIQIYSEDGEIEVSVAGGPMKKKIASPAVRRPDGTIAIADADGDFEGSYVTVVFPPAVGTHAYKSPYSNSGTHVQYHITGGNAYTCAYVTGNRMVASGGGVTITSMGDDDGFIKGTFTADPAGYGPTLQNTSSIAGKFRVKKSW